jgi:nucleotide-binding universal stress UspA family protein
MLPIRTILHPTDFSARSADAFQLACSLARDYGARLIVLHVKSPVFVYGEAPAMLPEPPDVLQKLREQLAQIQPPDAGVSVQHLLKEGEAATTILHAAQEAQADLVVMGTHGRTGFSRLLMGSVAEEVVRKASCPVLTVKTPLEKISTPPSVHQEPAQTR